MMKWFLATAFCLLGVAAAPAQGDDALPALVELISQSDDPQFQLDLLRGMKAGLQGRRQVAPPKGWDDAARKLKDSPNAEIQELARSLSLVFGSDAAMADLRRQLMDKEAAADARRKALAGLLAAKDAKLAELLRSLLDDPALRGEALRALAAYDDPGTPMAVLEVYGSLSAPEKRDALNTLVSRKAYVQALLAAVEAGQVPARDLTADVVRLVRQFNDEAIDAAVTKVWGVARESSEDKQQEIARLRKMITDAPPGHVSKGRAVYARTCQQCHTLFGQGGAVGPDITGSNRGDMDYILHNMVDPNAEIPNDYRTSTVETKDERLISGIIKDQNANAVTVATANDTVVVPRSEIAVIEQGRLSMMPEGLVEVLKEEEIRDLVAYLRSPHQVPLWASDETVGLFFDGETLNGWDGDLELWQVDQGEIVGTSPGLARNEWLSGPLLLQDFRFICKVKLVPNQGNSGIQFRSQRLEDGEVMGYQADVGTGWWGKLYEEHGRALLWDKPGDAHVRAGEWNTYEILARGSRIQTAINGRLCVDLDDPMGAREGILAFQIHSGGSMQVRYRDFEIELDPKPGLKTAAP